MLNGLNNFIFPYPGDTAEIEEGHAAERIIETAAKINSDLIVMGTYGWRGVNKAIMGSTTERVLADATCPILIVR